MIRVLTIIVALIVGAACGPGTRRTPCNDDRDCPLAQFCSLGVCTTLSSFERRDAPDEDEEFDPELQDPDADAGPADDEELDAGPADSGAGPLEEGDPDAGPLVANLMPQSRLGITVLNDSNAVTCETVFDIAPPVDDEPGVLRCTHTLSRPGYFRRGAKLDLQKDQTYTLSFFFKNEDVVGPYGRAALNTGLLATTYDPYEEFRGSLSTTTDVGNGWYRQSLSFVPRFTKQYDVNFNQSVDQDPIGTYYLFGFQLELAASAGPYTPN